MPRSLERYGAAMPAKSLSRRIDPLVCIITVVSLFLNLLLPIFTVPVARAETLEPPVASSAVTASNSTATFPLLSPASVRAMRGSKLDGPSAAPAGALGSQSPVVTTTVTVTPTLATATAAPSPTATASPRGNQPTASASATATATPKSTLPPTATVSRTPSPTATVKTPSTLTVTATLAATPTLTATIVVSDTEIEVSPAQGGTLQSKDGKLTLDIPPGAVTTTVRLKQRAWPDAQRGKFAYVFELDAQKKDDNAPLKTFARPLTLTVNIAALNLAGVPDSSTLWFYTLNPKTGQWEQVPTRRDPLQQTITAYLTHFSPWSVGGGANMTPEGLPSIQGFNQVDRFTGNASVNYPLVVPPGPGNFQPALALSYSSNRGNDVKRDHLASDSGYVGDGWSLNGLPSISRDVHGTPQNVADDTFYLSASFGSGRLLSDGTYWHTADETFVRLWRDLNEDGNWHALDQNGTSYLFTPKADYWTLLNNGACSSSSDVHVPVKYLVTSIGDRHGNTITIAYDSEVGTLSTSCGTRTFTRISHPRTITYGVVAVTFNYAWKNPGPSCNDQNQVPCEQYWLDNVEMRVNGALARRYLLGRVLPDRANYLASLTQRGSNDASTLPAYQFTYGTLDNADNGLLTVADNGYGGQVEFHYLAESVPQACNDVWCWNPGTTYTRYVVSSKTVRSLNPASAFTANYAYSGASVQDNSNTDAEENGYKFVGHTQVTEYLHAGDIASAVVSQGMSWFHQRLDPAWNVDPRQGKAYEVRLLDGLGNLYGKTLSTYYAQDLVHRSSGTPLNNVNFVRLDEVNQYSCGGASSCLQKRTTYTYDAYGNVVDEYRYGDVSTGNDDLSIHRWFNVNTTAWVVNRLGWENVYATIIGNVGGANLKTQTLHTYDGMNNWWEALPSTSKGDLIKIERGTGSLWATTWHGYDPYGNRNSTTDPNGHSTTTLYDGVLRALPVQVSNALNPPQVSSYSYDYTLAKVLSITDPNGGVSRYTYDVFGRRLTVNSPTEPDVNYPTVRYTYYDQTPFMLRTDQRLDTGGSVSPVATALQVYNGLGQLIQSQTPGDSSGQVIVTDSCYNSLGKVSKRTLPRVVSPYYLTAYVPQDCNQPGTSTLYDAAGQMVLVTAPDGATSTTVYANAWTTQVDANGHWRFNASDAYGRLTQVQETLTTWEEPFNGWDYGHWAYGCCISYDSGAIHSAGTGYSWDANFWRTADLGSAQDQGIKVEFKVDSNDTVAHFMLEGSGSPYRRFGVIAGGNKIYVQYSDGVNWYYPQDLVNPIEVGAWYVLTLKATPAGWAYIEVWRKDDPSKHGTYLFQMPGGVGYHFHHWIWRGNAWLDNYQEMNYQYTFYTYDVLGNLTQVKDALNNITTLTYDALSRKTAMSDPDMGAWSYGYDALGNLTSQTDAKNQVLNFTYDNINRLTHKWGSGLDVWYRYDEAGHGSGVTQRTSMTDGSGSASWTYDARGRITQESKAINGAGTFVTSMTYDAADRVRTLTYPDNEVVSNSYSDPRGLLNSVAGTNTYVSGSSYNALGQILSQAYGNGRTTTYTYRSDNYRLQRLQVNSAYWWTSNLDLQYTYDSVGNVLTIFDSYQYQQQNFTYDALNRLTRGYTTLYGSGPYDESYTYNAIGNLSNKAGLGYTYSASAANCAAGTAALKPHAVSQAGANTYAYDCNGNLSSRTENSVSYTQGWDSENHLSSVSGNGHSIQYTYDGDGQRVKRVDNGVSSAYVGHAYEWNSTNGVTKYYYAAGTRVAMRQGTNVYYLHGDHLHSTSVSTDINGNWFGQTLYLPFGGTRYSSGGQPSDYLYTGQRQESTTGGLYDYGARFYDPLIGRFISADMVVPGADNPQALNRYSYVFNNPLKYKDPSGHCPWCGDFVKGFLNQMGYNANPIPSGYVASADELAVSQYESDAMLIGRLAGSVGSGIMSYLEIAGGVAMGTGGTAGGILTCAETLGLGCLAGAAAIGAGATLATEGVLTGARAADSAAQSAAILMARRSTIPTIDPPTDRSALRRAMGQPPAGMKNPQAHHDLPWKFREWFAGKSRGINVNDSQFGRWVEGSPEGLHQNWTREYEDAWAQWIRDNPDATQQEVLDYLNSLLNSGNFP